MEHAFVADTNLFFECKRLEEIPWSDLAADPVVVALTKPVLAEIDKHKKAGGRTRKRAVQISGRVREMLSAASPETVIKEAGPRVLLRLMPIVQPDPEFAGSLDYNINDDRIVGTVATLEKEHRFASVAMLTDDSVAASTAHGLGLAFFLIPQSWKRPPEETTEAKRIKELEKDLSAYRAQEPIIGITNASGDATVTNVVRRVPLPLNSVEIDQLIDQLRTRFPIKTDFTAPEVKVQADGSKVSYEKPDAEVVEQYINEAYPQWIDRCRDIFRNLHNGRLEREAKVALTFGVTNTGTRPASKMRVSFKAVGNIHLSRKSRDPDNNKDGNRGDGPSAETSISRLPAPPLPPAVRRIVSQPPAEPKRVDINALSMLGSGLKLYELKELSRNLSPSISEFHAAKFGFERVLGSDKLADLIRIMRPTSEVMRHLAEQERLQRSILSRSELAFPKLTDSALRDFVAMPEKHNPEVFYYDSWTSQKSVKQGALTCDLFRHQRGEELFEIDVRLPENGDVSGAVRCTVEAENLTKPVDLLIPVGRKVEQFSLMALAKEMIEQCGS